MMAVLWWRRHYFCHARLGIKCRSWSNFCMLVWLFVLDGFCYIDIIRMCGHVMNDVNTLWWSRESWYDFSPSWLKFSSWWDFVCLGAIDWILVWFFFVLAKILVLVGPVWFGVDSYLGANNCILVWFFFVLVDYFALVWFCLIRGYFISWCD